MPAPPIGPSPSASSPKRKVKLQPLEDREEDVLALLKAAKKEANRKEPLQIGSSKLVQALKGFACPPGLIHSHPLFRDISDELCQELLQHVQQVNLKVQDNEDPATRAERNQLLRGSKGLLNDIFESASLALQAKVVLSQGQELPEVYKGVLLTFPDDAASFEVLFNGYGLANCPEAEIIRGAAGQEVAFGVTQTCPFLVRMWRDPIQGAFLIPTSALGQVLDKPKHLKHARKIRARVHAAAASFISNWLIRHFSKVNIKSFASLSEEFKLAVLKSITVRLVSQGTVICREGESTQTAICVYNGEAEVTLKGTHVAYLSRESFQSIWSPWWGLLECVGTNRERMATVTATRDCVLLELEPSKLQALRADFPQAVVHYDKIAMKHLKMLMPHQERSLNIHIFRECGASFNKALRASMTQRLALPGEYLMRQGEDGDAMYILVQGTCSVYRGDSEEPINTLFPGSCLGELAVLGISMIRTATVKCDSVCDLQVLTRTSLIQVLELFPQELGILNALTEERGRGRKTAAVALKKASIAGLDDKAEGVSQKFCEALTNNMFEQPFFPGQPIITQGIVGQYLVVLTNGEVDIEANGVRVASGIKAPAIFGEQALVRPGSLSTATVLSAAVCDCLMLPVSQALTASLKSRFPEDMHQLEETLIRKISNTNKTLNVEPTEAEKPTVPAFKVNLFNDCDPAFMARMSQLFEKMVFLNDQALLTEGAESSHGYIIQEGRAVVKVKGNKVAEVGPGDFLGEVVILGFANTSTASVIAAEHVTAYALEKKAAREVLATFPKEMHRLEQIMMKRFRRTNNIKKFRTFGRIFNQLGLWLKYLRRKADEAKMKAPISFKHAQTVSFSDRGRRASYRGTTDSVTFDLSSAQKLAERLLSMPENKVHPLATKKKSEPSESLGRSGRKQCQLWMKNRVEALIAAEDVKWKRLQAKGTVMEPISGAEGYRVPDTGLGAPWATDAKQSKEDSPRQRPGALRLKKTNLVYGRKVWMEAFTPQSAREPIQTASNQHLE